MVVRVGKYTRRSTDEDHQPFSIEAQDAKLDAYIASQDDWHHDPDCDFTDNQSGYTLDRPGLQRALTYARAGRYDLLLVAKVDRLSRSIRGLTQILDELDTAGVAFRSATEPFDTATPAGRMMVQMLGVFAEFERRMIIDRVIAGMERKAARGAWTVGSIPFGYLTDPETGLLVPVPSQAPLVPIIFDLYGNKRYIGAAANGNRYRYRYYVCFSRHRYGPDTCPSERVDAEQLERALLDALLTTLERTDLIERAAANLVAQLGSHRTQYQAQVESVEEELRRTEKAIDRYMLGFEEGRIDLDRFGPRMEELALAAKKLEKSRDSLLAALDDTGVAPPAVDAATAATRRPTRWSARSRTSTRSSPRPGILGGLRPLLRRHPRPARRRPRAGNHQAGALRAALPGRPEPPHDRRPTCPSSSPS